MKDVVKDEIIKELSLKYDKKEEVILQMLNKADEIGYNSFEAKCLINSFYKK